MRVEDVVVVGGKVGWRLVGDTWRIGHWVGSPQPSPPGLDLGRRVEVRERWGGESGETGGDRQCHGDWAEVGTPETEWPSAPNITYHQVITLQHTVHYGTGSEGRREIYYWVKPQPSERALIPGQPYVSHYGLVGIMDWARWARDYIDWSRSLRGFSHSPELEPEPESGDLGQFSLTTCLRGSEKERKARASH